MNKQFYTSKRFWTGVLALITALSLIFTGDKTWDQQLPEIVMAILAVAQTVLGITSNTSLYAGKKRLD